MSNYSDYSSTRKFSPSNPHELPGSKSDISTKPNTKSDAIKQVVADPISILNKKQQESSSLSKHGIKKLEVDADRIKITSDKDKNPSVNNAEKNNIISQMTSLKIQIKQLEAKIEKLETTGGSLNDIEKGKSIKSKKEEQLAKLDAIKTGLEVSAEEASVASSVAVEKEQKEIKKEQKAIKKEQKEIQEADIESKYENTAEVHDETAEVHTKTAEVHTEIEETQSTKKVRFEGKAEREWKNIYEVIRGAQGVQFVISEKPKPEEKNKDIGLKYLGLIKEKKLVHRDEEDGTIHYPRGMHFKKGDKIPVLNPDKTPAMDSNGKPIMITLGNLHEMSEEEYAEFSKVFSNYISDTWIKPQSQASSREQEAQIKPNASSTLTRSQKAKDESTLKKEEEEKKISRSVSVEILPTTKAEMQKKLEAWRKKIEKKRHDLGIRIGEDNLKYSREKFEEVKEAREKLDAMENNIKNARSKQEMQALEVELIEIENLMKTLGGERKRKLSIKEHGKLKRTKS